MNKKYVIAVLLKDLPMCPKGRYFQAENWDGTISVFFHRMTDDERIEDKLKRYAFTYKEIQNNPSWFKIIEK
jgi:hypothetical protein